MTDRRQVVVVGAGPVGCVLSILLAERGYAVSTYEKRPDMRVADIDGGRSINLVLTRRGLRALEMLGFREAMLQLSVPVLGRMMHSTEGELRYQPYGKDDSECNYSISRDQLNAYLLDRAERAGCQLHFSCALTEADFDAGRLRFENADGAFDVSTETVFGCDGAGSGVRKTLVEDHGAQDSLEWLEHGYKETHFPADDDGEFAMAGHALHIWPRGSHFLMGLANTDGSFTGTVYLKNEGPESFESLDTVEKVTSFFEAHYPDAIELLDEDYAQQFLDLPLGHLGTVRCAPWHYKDRALLLGDAAHAIVPFFGQGLNSGFEDCAVLMELLDESDDLTAVFEAFYHRRKTNVDAIADMALENFVEMRDRVADDHFLLKKAIEQRLEQEYPDLYRSRYATVMYSYNGYRAAYEAGKIQSTILDELARDAASADDVDLDVARQLIDRKLTPFYREHDVELGF